MNKLTVVMSVLNGEPHLYDAVVSILNQTYKTFDFIIINNGSTDGTKHVLEKLAEQDSRIKLINNAHTVTYVEGRTQGINAAETEWVALMDADDIAMPTRLERQVKYLEQHHERIGALGTWGYYINEDGQVLGNMKTGPSTIAEFEDLYQGNEAIVLIDPSCIIHKPTFFAAGGYRPQCVPAADLDLWYRVAETGKYVLALPEKLVKYRVHKGSDSVKRTMVQRKLTHFINYNMRRRRNGQEELNMDQFNSQVWSDVSYRKKREKNDRAMAFYKQAALAYAEKKYHKLAWNMFMVLLIKPSMVFERLYVQKIKKY